MVVEQETRIVKGLLTPKSRISKRNTSITRLELVSSQMAANMACVPSLERVAHCICHSVDGQHGSALLDFKSRKTLEGIRSQPSEEDRRKYRRTRDQLEVLPNGKEPCRPGKQRRPYGQDGQETGSQDQWLLSQD